MDKSIETCPIVWLALVVGNSRLHWALLSPDEVLLNWDTAHLNEGAIAPLLSCPKPLIGLLTLAPVHPHSEFCLQPPLLLASVVPDQTRFWQRHFQTQIIALDQIPLTGLYPTLGIDRALAVLGAGVQYGFPTLVIDGGTALTFTGADGDRTLVGGAILPGLQTQGRAIAQQTAALPKIEVFPDIPVPRWATTTPDAIRSGILYTLLAGIGDFIGHWRQRYPNSSIVFTGGDGAFLLAQTQHHHAQVITGGSFDAVLVFRGIQTLLPCKTIDPSGN